MSDRDIVVSSRENYEAALERAEKAEAECRILAIQLETCRQHGTTLREVGDQMLKDYQKTTLELERERKAAAEMRGVLESLCCGSSHCTGDDTNWTCLRVLQEGNATTICPACKAQQFLAGTDAGRDYFHRDEFKPLCEALECISQNQTDDYRRVASEALAHARQKGLIS